MVFSSSTSRLSQICTHFTHPLAAGASPKRKEERRRVRWAWDEGGYILRALLCGRRGFATVVVLSWHCAGNEGIGGRSGIDDAYVNSSSWGSRQRLRCRSCANIMFPGWKRSLREAMLEANLRSRFTRIHCTEHILAKVKSYMRIINL